MARKKKPSLSDNLAILDTEETLEGVDFDLFSDLGPEDLAAVEARWPDWPVRLRRSLLETAGELSEQNFRLNFDALARLGLDDPDGDVRLAALEGLWESDDSDLIPTFIRMMGGDPAITVRAEAAKNLGRYVYLGECGELLDVRARRVQDALLAVLAGVDDVEVRRRALESLSYSGRPEVAPIIEAAYHTGDAAWRASAVFAMGRNLDERWVPIVQAELESAVPEMRYEAARAAGELEIQNAIASLAKLTLDPDLQIQEAAIWSLGQIGGEQASAALRLRRRTAGPELHEAIDDALATADLANLGFGLLDLVEDEEEEDDGIVLN
jgi:HEAT repeat protein